MSRASKRALLRTTPILGVLSTGVLFLVCMICINECREFFPAFAECFDSGRSVFVPDLPRIDLLWFLPPDKQPVAITWGNIIDVIVFINIALTLNKIPYDCYRRVKEGQMVIPIVDLHLDKRDVKDRPGDKINEKSCKPCMDVYSILGSPARKNAGHADLAPRNRCSGLEAIPSTNRRISRAGSRRARVAVLTFMAFVSSRIFSSFVVNEMHHRSGSCFSRKSSLHFFLKKLERFKYERL
nr:hypothetical protein [Candidatus Sigynarchaeum springense]